MKLIADLHLHSKYSRACSKELDIPNMVKYAKIKGVNLMGTGDFQHPKWQSSSFYLTFNVMIDNTANMIPIIQNLVTILLS